MDRIEFEPEELSVAEQWHGGQSSMLYAIASTGSLKRGVERCRPRRDCDACGSMGRVYRGEPPVGVSSYTTCRACLGRKMTDAQWLVRLAGCLESEAEESAAYAREQENHEDAELLDGIAEKCRVAIIKLGGES